MSKLIKPKKPTIKRPRLPRRPSEPNEYGQEWHIGDVFTGCLNDGLLGDEDWTVESELGMLFISVETGEISFTVKSDTYESEMEEYRKKMEEWEEKSKAVQPSIDRYEEVMAEYNVALLAWKKQQAEERLSKMREKIAA